MLVNFYHKVCGEKPVPSSIIAMDKGMFFLGHKIFSMFFNQYDSDLGCNDFTLDLSNAQQLKNYNNSKICGNIIIDSSYLNLTLDNDLILIATKNIIFNPATKITINGNGSLYLKSGIEDLTGKAKVIFEGKNQIDVVGQGKVVIHYNPESITKHKYHSPNGYFDYVTPLKAVDSYMLVNNVHDLQDIRTSLHGKYALSNDIDALETKKWDNGHGFKPLTINEKNIPFSGYFDGNDYTISDLYINRQEENNVGLFGIVAGQERDHSSVTNLKLKNAEITGKKFVGTVSGTSEYALFSNIDVISTNIVGIRAVGGVIGTTKDTTLQHISLNTSSCDFIHTDSKYKGLLIGTAKDTELCENYISCSDTNADISLVGLLVESEKLHEE